MKLILASASPRRKELLKQIGLEFEAIAACGEEISASLEPQQAVTELSRQKAEEIAQKRKGFAAPELILGADTAVAFMGQILGKPKEMRIGCCPCFRGTAIKCLPE